MLTLSIEVNIEVPDLADEEQLFFLRDEKEETEEEIFALRR